MNELSVAKVSNNWLVYILECADKTFYTGITNDVEKRLVAHNAGKGAKYTSGRLPVRVVYLLNGLTESAARKEEFRIKKLSRKEKEQMVN